MKPIAIIKLGDTYPDLAARLGGFDDWIAAGLTAGEIPVQVDDIGSGAALPAPAALSGAVLTGSHAMLTDNPDWNSTAAKWLQRAVAAGLPVLGICYGHQLLAHAFGGRVGYNPSGTAFGTVTVHLSTAARTDLLLGHLPAVFPAHACHRQSVLGLPDGAVPLAWSDHDPCLAFRIGTAAWGVQFHPEFPDAAMRAYIGAAATDLLKEGRQPDQLLAGVVSTPAAAGILRRFSAIAAAARSG